MKKRSYRMFIEDVLESMNKIEHFIEGLTYQKFAEDEMAADAVVRNLEIIGEATKNIPKEIREKYPGIPWKRMIGLRNIVIHEYFGVDLSIVWEIITKNLPETKPMIIEILEKFDEEKEL